MPRGMDITEGVEVTEGQYRNKEAVWRQQQQPFGMCLSYIQHIRYQLQPCVWKSERISVCSNNCIRSSNSSIDSNYLSGVSLTHGPPGARQHIWSFAAGFGEGDTRNYGCPCANLLNTLAHVPSFVGNDFFCESGNPVAFGVTHVLYPDDPLWDGQGCAAPPCCELSYPPGVTAPWFCKQLPQTTTDNIEARICHSYDHTDEDTPLELVELYIR